MESDYANMQPIEITDDAINSLYTPVVDGWSVNRNQHLNLEHQSLLQSARMHPVGVEVAACYKKFPVGKIVTVGKTGSVTTMFAMGNVYMHNHPSGNTFTMRDVEIFLFNANIELLTAVGNNGTVYLLQKVESYDFTGIYREYQAAQQKFSGYENSPELYIKFMESFLNSLNNHGIIYRKSR
jgi:hypothetical protein